jgi:hypothetical protein
MTQRCKRGHEKPAVGRCAVCTRARSKRFHTPGLSVADSVAWAESTPIHPRRKGFCLRGHAYTPPSTGGFRGCPVCFRAYQWAKRRGQGVEYGLAQLVDKPVGSIQSPPPSYLGHCKAGLEAKLTPSIIEIAWAAGIYEGEGHARLPGSVSVTQKDRWILDKLQSFFGGTIGRAGRSAAYRDTIMWTWNISGTRARGFLMTIYGFLSPRRKAQALPLWQKAA